MIITVKTRTILPDVDDNVIMAGNYYFASSPPCRECLNYLKNLGINKIYYSTLEGHFEMVKTNQESPDDYKLSDAQKSFVENLEASKSKKRKHSNKK